MAAQRESSSAAQEPGRWVRIGSAVVVLCALIALASWLKTDLTRNDFERFDDLRLSFAFFALCAGLALTYVAAYTSQSPVSGRAIAWVTAGAIAALWSSFPVGSKDIFGYAFYGRILDHYHQSPYLAVPADFPNDAWSPFVQARWRTMPTAYGPLFLWQTAVVDALAGPSVWAAVWWHKVLAVGWLLLALWVSARLLHEHPASLRRRVLVLLAWNPLLLFETAGNGHNDIAMVALVLLALWSWKSEQPEIALVALAASFCVKWYGLLFAPPFLVATYQMYGARRALRSAGAAAAFVALMGVVVLFALPGSLQPMLSGLLHPGALRGIYPSELSPPLAAIFWSLRAIGSFDTEWGQQLFDAIRIALFGMAVAAALIRQLRTPAPFPALVESCCVTGSAFFLLLITMLLPWHLMVVIALATVRAREPWLLWAVTLTLLGLASYFLTFPVAALAGAISALAIWSLRWIRVHGQRAPLSGLAR
jgi:hypothetical protein